MSLFNNEIPPSVSVTPCCGQAAGFTLRYHRNASRTCGRDLRRFYPLVVEALRKPSNPSNNWVRAVRNICRFRNHALHPDTISDADLYQLIEQLLKKL